MSQNAFWRPGSARPPSRNWGCLLLRGGKRRGKGKEEDKKVEGRREREGEGRLASHTIFRPWKHCGVCYNVVAREVIAELKLKFIFRLPALLLLRERHTSKIAARYKTLLLYSIQHCSSHFMA